MMILSTTPPAVWSAWNDVWAAVTSFVLLGVGGLALLAFTNARLWLVRKVLSEFRDRSRLSTEMVRNNGLIDNILTELQIRFECIRARVHLFHNGEVFLLASHSWKSSCTHEITAPGTTREMRNELSILVSQNTDVIAPIVSGDETITRGCVRMVPPERQCGDSCKVGRNVFRYDVQTMDMRTARFDLEQAGVCHMLVVNLQTMDTVSRTLVTFGYLALQFAEMSDTRMKWIETQLCSLCTDANRIQLLLAKNAGKPG